MHDQYCIEIGELYNNSKIGFYSDKKCEKVEEAHSLYKEFYKNHELEFPKEFEDNISYEYLKEILK